MSNRGRRRASWACVHNGAINAEAANPATNSRLLILILFLALTTIVQAQVQALQYPGAGLARSAIHATHFPQRL